MAFSGVPQGSVLSLTLLFINDLHDSVSEYSTLHKSSSFHSQPSSNAHSQSRLDESLTINPDLQSNSEWGTCNLVQFNIFDSTQFFKLYIGFFVCARNIALISGVTLLLTCFSIG